MAINFRCGRCGQLLQAADEAVGRIVACPGCAAQLPVPGTAPASPTVPMVPAARPAAARPSAAPAAPQPLPQPLPQPRSLPEPQPFVTVSEPNAGGTRLRRRSSLDKRMVLIVAGAAVLLIAAVVGAMLMVGGGGSGGRSVSRAVRYLPDDAEIVFSVNMSAVTKSKLWQKVEKAPAVKQALDQMRAEGNTEIGDIAHITAGASANASTPVVIMETHKRIDRKTIFGRAAQTEEKIAGQTVYVRKGGEDQAAYLPNDRTLVFGTKRALRAVLERKGDPPAKVKSLADQLKGSAAISMAMRPSHQAAGPMPAEFVEDVQSIAVHADVGGDVRVAAELLCKDGEAAKRLKQLSEKQLAEIDKAPDVPATFRETLQKIKISQSGSRLSAEVTISEAMVDQIIAMASLMDGPGIGRGPGAPPPRPSPVRPPRAGKPPRSRDM